MHTETKPVSELSAKTQRLAEIAMPMIIYSLQLTIIIYAARHKAKLVLPPFQIIGLLTFLIPSLTTRLIQKKFMQT